MAIIRGYIASLMLCVVYGEKLCFDNYCFNLPNTPINRTLLAECACGLLLSGVRQLTHIRSFNATNCEFEFGDVQGARAKTVQLKGPDYKWPPKVLEEDSIGVNYGSMSVFIDSCNVLPNGKAWAADNRSGRRFVWDLGILYRIGSAHFRNSRNWNFNNRHVIEFKVYLSRYYGEMANWVEVLHVKDLPHPLLCDPIKVFTWNSTIARYVKFVVLKSYGQGVAMHYFRVF